ncbi:MAG: molybdate ABC transporter substrate-binding protein, partial [Acidimicrobiia bacterium]
MRRLLLSAALIVTLLGASCSSGEPPDDELLVFAAASLTDAFTAQAAAYEEAHPAVEVTLSFASSSSLRDQILEGAPADVFASANTATMDQVVAAGAARDPAPFAGNELDIAVPPGNPAGVTGLGDFADEDLILGLCIAEAPC